MTKPDKEHLITFQVPRRLQYHIVPSPDYLLLYTLYRLKNRLGVYDAKPFVSFLLEPDLKPMVVCTEKKFLFMRTARTGTCSIYRKYMQEKLRLRTWNNRNNYAALIRWAERLDEETWRSCFKFSFVRNPWDRVVSLYFHFRFKCSFKTFVQNFEVYVRRVPEFALHAMPAHHLTHHEGRQFIDFIGRYETLQTDFNEVCRIIGIPETTLPLARKTEHEHYCRYYDRESEEIVRKIYAGDILRFGYSFGD